MGQATTVKETNKTCISVPCMPGGLIKTTNLRRAVIQEIA